MQFNKDIDNFLFNGNNIDVLKTFEDNSIDSVVTDPPYGLSFMNKKWDYDVPSVEFWREVYRVLKPGGHILSFGGTRTYHRMVVNMEDAGFEIRDQIMWIYGSGFPKSLNIGKKINSPYEGWGTGLKPANEPICLARKPLSEKTVAENVLKYSTGGINIDECRVGSEIMKEQIRNVDKMFDGQVGFKKTENNHIYTEKEGRFPANVIFDEEASDMLDDQSYGASRFFYVAKTSKKERNLGLDNYNNVEDKGSIGLRTIGGTPLYEKGSSEMINTRINKNNHPTVKPINLLTYLCRLITPKGGIILDPFMGSGSCGISARLEGFRFVGIELDEDYFKIATARIDNYEQYKKLLKK